MAQPPTEPLGTAPPARTVLVVDDEDDQRALLVTHVRRAGFQVVEAPTAEDALEQLAISTPDLALIDLVLPGMGGAELSERIRTRYPACAIVVTSVLDVEDYPRADAVLPKPFTRSQVVSILRRLLPG